MARDLLSFWLLPIIYQEVSAHGQSHAQMLGDQSAIVIAIKTNMYLLSENLNNNNPIVTSNIIYSQSSPLGERMLNSSVYLLSHT